MGRRMYSSLTLALNFKYKGELAIAEPARHVVSHPANAYYVGLPHEMTPFVAMRHNLVSYLHFMVDELSSLMFERLER